MKPTMFALVVCSLLFAACSSEAPAPAREPVTDAAPPAAETAKPEPAPTPEPAPPVKAYPTDIPGAIVGANVETGQMTVDGFTVEQLVCKGPGGVFASMAIVGRMAEQVEAFGKCADKRELVRVHFAYHGGKVGDIRVAGASRPEVARCVGDTVAATTFPGEYTCVMSFKVGPLSATTF